MKPPPATNPGAGSSGAGKSRTPPRTPPRTKPPGPTPPDPPRATLRQPRALKDRPNPMRLALRRGRKRLRPVLLGLACLVLVALAGRRLFHRPPGSSLLDTRARIGAAGAAVGLVVRHVRILGRDATPQPLLDAALGVAPGDPLLGFSVAQARARLLTIASIQDATVERLWPDTVQIQLAERQAIAVWQNDRHFALIDRAGAVLADQDIRRLAAGLKLVVGPGAPTHAAALLDALARHPAIGAEITAAIFVGNRRWNLETDTGCAILLPERAEDAALDRLDRLNAADHLLERPLRIIDLRLDDRITLRPYASAPPTPMPTAPMPPAPPSAAAASAAAPHPITPPRKDPP